MKGLAGFSLAAALALPALAQDFQLPPLATAPGPASSVRVEKIVFRGNRAIGDAELQKVAAAYVGRAGREMGADELEAMRQALTRVYTERGYVNSGVLLPAQPSDGVLTLEVVEGRLSALRLHGMDGLNERYLSARLLRPDDGALNIDQLRERFQLLLDDPLFERINARLEPGAAAGEAVLDVEVKRARPWHLSVFANNYRPASIGAEALGVAGSLRNLTGLGDLLELKLQTPTRRANGSTGGNGNLSWQLPLAAFGLTGTQISLAAEGGSSSVIEEPVRPLDIRSKLSSHDVGLSQRVFESLNQSLSIGLNRVSRSNRTELLGEPFSFTPGVPDGETRETLWRFWQSYAWRSEQQVLALRSSFSWGRNNVQEIPGLPSSEDTPARRFSLWSGQLHYGRQVLDNGAQLIARLSVQLSPDRLLALDGLTVGGVNSVRGYRENQLVSDTGAFLNLEFEYPWIQQPGIKLSVTPFIDLGTARSKGRASTSLSSLGLALRWHWLDGLQVDLAVAHHLRKLPGGEREGSSLQDDGVHLQVAWKF